MCGVRYKNIELTNYLSSFNTTTLSPPLSIDNLVYRSYFDTSVTNLITPGKYSMLIKRIYVRSLPLPKATVFLHLFM